MRRAADDGRPARPDVVQRLLFSFLLVPDLLGVDPFPRGTSNVSILRNGFEKLLGRRDEIGLLQYRFSFLHEIRRGLLPALEDDKACMCRMEIRQQLIIDASSFEGLPNSVLRLQRIDGHGLARLEGQGLRVTYIDYAARNALKIEKETTPGIVRQTRVTSTM